MKLIGKLHDGTIFTRKGHDDEEPFEFKTDEGMLLSFGMETCIDFSLEQVIECGAHLSWRMLYFRTDENVLCFNTFFIHEKRDATMIVDQSSLRDQQIRYL